MDKEFLNADALTIKDNTIASNTSEIKGNIGSNITTVYHELFPDGWGPYLGKCPHCGSANIEANYNIVLTSMPAQYNCRCKDCKGTFFSGQIKQESQTITPYNPDPGLPNYPDQPQKPQYGWGDTRQGWICPRCGKVNSPDRDFCDCSGNGGWGSPIIWCNSDGTSAGLSSTTSNASISGLTNDQSITGSIYGFEACNLHEKPNPPSPPRIKPVTFTENFSLKEEKDYENEAREAAAETDKKVKELQAEADAIAKEKAAEAEANAIAIKSLEVARMLGLTTTVNDIEIIKPNLTSEESKLIADYLKYIEYLSIWDGKLPEVVTDGSGIIINP